MTTKIEEIIKRELRKAGMDVFTAQTASKNCLAALDAAGLKVLPKDWTAEMLDAAAWRIVAEYDDPADDEHGKGMHVAKLVALEANAAFDPNTWKPAE